MRPAITFLNIQLSNSRAKLKKITIKSKKLTQKSIASGAFKGIKKNTVILVQKSKRTTYRKLFVKKGLNKKITVKAI
ncbi:hypothetical protein [uncultured Faecalicoccus sp.]|uniref:hypothetical protein n=1 Tax=uncultured Faecalicoccus sp. TaxID=1971760 RepID=UPI0025D8CBFE|nr:hypothetical protein [uncultured Faecalicoccus sp.]